jgi:DNA topoisomerase I
MEIKIRRSKLRKIVTDNIGTAEAANLVYTNDTQPGIEREKKGDRFIYKLKGTTVTDINTLSRIRSLVIPPAWTKVWICPIENGHLQVTGYDIKNRKQYKYHSNWNLLRSHTKYYNLYEFGKAMPIIRQRLQKDFLQKELTQEKVLATVILLMQCTCMRIGNSVYEKLNGSFGLTTLKDKHVSIEGGQMKFSFKGKKGVYHDITLKSKKLARIVQACKDIPGKELFQYYDENGVRKAIDSGMVNSYIKTISGGNFTAKDFRTWAGSLQALQAFKELDEPEMITEAKRKIVEVLDVVAKQLGNTRAVCKKYYVHPALLDLYTNNQLSKYISDLPEINCDPTETDLTSEEKVLLKILEKHGSVVITNED